MMTNYRLDWMTDQQWYCTEVLAAVAGGHHHLFTPREYGDGVRVTWRGYLSTYDGNELTRLVLAAHAAGVRIHVEPGGRYLAVVAHYRGVREGRLWQRHPTINTAIGEFVSQYDGPRLQETT